MVLRIYYQQRGGHVHCRVFSGPDGNRTLGKSGDLVFTAEEWPTVKACLEGEFTAYDGQARFELRLEAIEEPPAEGG